MMPNPSNPPEGSPADNPASERTQGPLPFPAIGSIAYPAQSAVLPPMQIRRMFQAGLALAAMGVLLTGLTMALVSVNSVIEIWFEYQWVPVARLVMGLVLCAIAMVGLFALTRVKWNGT